MKKRAKLVVWVSGFAMAMGASASLRVASYNIYHGENMKKVINIDCAGSVLAKYNPDLVALQEVDNKTDRSGRIDQAAALGLKLGMDSRFKKACMYYNGDYGIAILSVFPIKKTIRHELPTPEGQEPRGALEIQVDVPDMDGKTNTVSFVCTHLGLSNEQRVAQVKALMENLSSRGHPIILAGDINAQPLEETMTALAEGGYSFLDKKEQFTFPSKNPNRKIDYILTKNFKFRHARFEVIPEPKASDHRPIFAEFIFSHETTD